MLCLLLPRNVGPLLNMRGPQITAARGARPDSLKKLQIYLFLIASRVCKRLCNGGYIMVTSLW